MIYIAYNLCVGCGACAELYPVLFEIRDDKAWVMNPDKFDPEKFDEMVNCCPFGAIKDE